MEQANQIWQEHNKRRNDNIQEWSTYAHQLQIQYDNHKVKMNKFLIDKSDLEKDQKRLENAQLKFIAKK